MRVRTDSASDVRTIESIATMRLETPLLAKPAAELLDEFGAGKAAPGSGSAAALMGLLACKLIVTVCIKSCEKDECKEDHAGFIHIKDQILRTIEPTLQDLFERDAKEFAEVVNIRVASRSISDLQQRSALTRKANDKLETATENLFAIVNQCFKLVDHGITAFNKGWHAIRGDSGAAISCALAGITAGIFIANLNLKKLKDRKYA